MQNENKTVAIAAINRRERCPICHNSSLENVHFEPYNSPALLNCFREHYQGRAATTDIEGFHYDLVSCEVCRFTFQRTVPGEKLLTEIYDQWIPYSALETISSTYTLDTYRYWAEQVEFLIQHLERRPREINVLDFGFGWAGWAQMAQSYGCRVYGTELSQERITHALTLGINVVPFDCLPSHRFHFINTEQVFEHLIDPLSVLRQLEASLEVGGLIKISVPDASKALKRLRATHGFSGLSTEEIMAIAPLEHINCFEYRSLLALGKQAKLRPVRPRLLLLYNSSSGWLRFGRAARLITRPVFRFIYPRSTFLYFTKDS